MQNVLSILFCLSLFYLVVTTSVKSYISVLRMQGVLLVILMILPFIPDFSIFGLILPLTMLVVKVILIPRYMEKIMNDLNIKREIESTLQQFNFLLLSCFSMAVIFIVSNYLSKSTEFAVIPFATAFSAVTIGIYIIMFRKKLIVHVIGFLVLENGIFMFGLAVASEFPIIIELGSLLDVFAVVFLMGIAINKISSTIFTDDRLAQRRDP
ncbi:MAG TPA: hypothetical protein PLX56_02415 [bacterium]|nr:hypothetical protein [bacterium]HQO91157.1 hypothetical protein [bacterium]HRQ68865.1 hypothetical protein [bacterium]